MTDEERRSKNRTAVARHRARVRDRQPIDKQLSRSVETSWADQERKRKNRVRVARHRARVRALEDQGSEHRRPEKQLRGGVEMSFAEISKSMGITERDARKAFVSGISQLRLHHPAALASMQDLAQELARGKYDHYPIQHP
jgi:hypothetical protein